MKGREYFKDNTFKQIASTMIEKGLEAKDLIKLVDKGDGKRYSYEGIRQILIGEGSYKGVYKVCEVLKISMKKVLKPKPFG